MASNLDSRRRRAKFLGGAAVVTAALLGLIGWAMTRPAATSFYYTVGELQALGSTAPERDLRVNGTVVPNSIHREGLLTSFAIADGGEKLVVHTRQPLPDAFRAGSEVVARGNYDGDSFAAAEVLAKCPSKFEAA